MSGTDFPLNGHSHVRIVVVSGLSGSGKSTAIRALEDIGFFCIDNLPIVLMPKLVELFPGTPAEIEQIAVVADAREGAFLNEFEKMLARIRAQGSRVDVVFLDCADEVLVRRYNETRRRHPLAPHGSLQDGIVQERSLLSRLRQLADHVFDTSGLNPHQLRQLIKEHFTRAQDGSRMNLALVSFGFRHGIPEEADLVFDVRFLPNPYFVAELREKNGTDPEVHRYVTANEDAQALLDSIAQFLLRFRPLYDREGKSYLSVCIGCTGGKHRSVAIVEELGRRLQSSQGPLAIRHRDMNRP